MTTGGAQPPAPVHKWRSPRTPGVEFRILAAIDDVDDALAGPWNPFPCLCGRLLPTGTSRGGLCPTCATAANV